MCVRLRQVPPVAFNFDKFDSYFASLGFEVKRLLENINQVLELCETVLPSRDAVCQEDSLERYLCEGIQMIQGFRFQDTILGAQDADSASMLKSEEIVETVLKNERATQQGLQRLEARCSYTTETLKRWQVALAGDLDPMALEINVLALLYGRGIGSKAQEEADTGSPVLAAGGKTEEGSTPLAPAVLFVKLLESGSGACVQDLCAMAHGTAAMIHDLLGEILKTSYQRRTIDAVEAETIPIDPCGVSVLATLLARRNLLSLGAANISSMASGDLPAVYTTSTSLNACEAGLIGE